MSIQHHFTPYLSDFCSFMSSTVASCIHLCSAVSRKWRSIVVTVSRTVTRLIHVVIYAITGPLNLRKYFNSSSQFYRPIDTFILISAFMTASTVLNKRPSTLLHLHRQRIVVSTQCATKHFLHRQVACCSLYTMCYQALERKIFQLPIIQLPLMHCILRDVILVQELHEYLNEGVKYRQ